MLKNIVLSFSSQGRVSLTRGVCFPYFFTKKNVGGCKLLSHLYFAGSEEMCWWIHPQYRCVIYRLLIPSFAIVFFFLRFSEVGCCFFSINRPHSHKLTFNPETRLPRYDARSMTIAARSGMIKTFAYTSILFHRSIRDP